MFKKICTPLLAVLVAMSFAVVSCNDDSDDIDKKDPVEVDPTKPSDGAMSAAESKKFLEETATEFMNKFRAADQRSVMALCSYFSDTYGELEAPREFAIEAEPSKAASPAAMFSATKTDLAAAPSSVTSWVYSIDFEHFGGIYEPGQERWVKRSDSNDVIFRFQNENGQPCELKAVASIRNTSDGSFEIEYADEEYDYEIGSWVDATTTETYNVRIPKEVTVTLTSGSSKLVDAKITSSINLKGHSLTSDTRFTVANITMTAKNSGSDSKITRTMALEVSGQTLANGTVTVNGRHLCDYEYLSKIDDQDDVLATFHSGTSKVSVMNKVHINASIDVNRDIVNVASDGEWYSEDAAAKAVNAINKGIKSYVTYNSSNTTQAHIVWDYVHHDSYYYGDDWYTVEPLLCFNIDNTKYSFEEYFSPRGFRNVEDQFYDLIQEYEKVWNAVSHK